MNQRLPDTATLGEARRHLRENWTKGVVCDCCNQRVQLYKRKLNAGMAYGLIQIYKISLAKSGYVHVPSEFTALKINTADTEFAKLKYWKLIDDMPSDEGDDKKNSGFWIITERGKMFVLNQLEVPKYVFIYNGLTFKGDGDTQMTDIYTALGDKFSYDELMGI